MTLNQVTRLLEKTCCPKCGHSSQWQADVHCEIYSHECVIHTTCDSCKSSFTIAAIEGVHEPESGEVSIICDLYTRVCEVTSKVA